jgi:RNA polymerase sigma-32 factor
MRAPLTTRPASTFFERECGRVRAQPPLSEDEERALARRWRVGGDRQAAAALVRSQLPLVQRLARRYRGYGVPTEELEAEGSVGLLRAVEKFDLRGVRFKTYATYWVRAQMLSYILRANSIVTRATGALGARLFFKLRRARARAETLLGTGHEGVDASLAEHFGITVEAIQAHTARLGSRDQSLDAPLSEDGTTTALELLVDDAASPEETAAAAQQDQAVHQVLSELWSGLDERERALISQRLMVDAEEGATLAELGQAFGLSRERFRQLEARVRARLGRAMAESGLAPEPPGPRVPTPGQWPSSLVRGSRPPRPSAGPRRPSPWPCPARAPAG